jgi:N-acetylglutamate synthase-like GNAT family acetyltransferase
MSEHPTVRSPDPGDAGRLREIARSSLTASYALSPDGIEGIIEEVFAEDLLRERIESDDASLYVADVDDVLAGFVQISADGDVGTIRWLEVDPERRGLGVGTALFGRAVSEIDDRSGNPQAVTLAASTSSGSFFERLGFERVEERSIEVAGEDIVEYVYAESDTGTPADSGDSGQEGTSPDAEPGPADDEDVDLPDEIETNGEETVYPGGEPIAGSEGRFVATFTDEARSDEYGYYCLNCGTTDVSMGSMDRLECNNCGNESRDGEDYDASYL